MNIIEASKLSDKIRRKSWASPDVVDLSDRRFIIVSADAVADDWEPVIEVKKETVLMYQAMVRSTIMEGRYMVSDFLFTDEDDAKSICGEDFIKLLNDRPFEVEVDE